MRTAIIRDGIVENVIEGVVDPVVFPGALFVDITGQHVGPGFSWDGATFSAPPIIVLRRILRGAFFSRLTDDELEDLEFLSLDDATAPVATRRAKARLRRVLRTLEAMEWIDLNNSRVRAWVQLLETRGLLAVGRAVQILDAPVQPDERV